MRDLTGKTLAGPDIPPFTARLVLMDLVSPPTAPPPAQLLHRFLLTGATITGGDTPGPLDYTGAPYAVTGTPVDLSPPLRGAGWVNFNGCCSPDSVHRNAILPVNGHLSDTQRFAVDYMRLDPQGQLVHGDPADYRNYTAFGAEVLAVADATVVATLDNLPEQVPGSLPDPSTITLETVDGNHVILDLGDGRYAFYAHLQPGSVRVQAGQRVTRGQPLGLLGNTGNTSAPHLHFHVMDGPSVLGSNGLPFTIDNFSLAGRIDPAQYNAAQDLTGVWNRGAFPAPQPLTRTYPLGLDLIDFPAEGGSGSERHSRCLGERQCRSLRRGGRSAGDAPQAQGQPDLGGAPQEEPEPGEQGDRPDRGLEVEEQDHRGEQGEHPHRDVPAAVLPRPGGDEEVVDPGEEEPQQQPDDHDHDAGRGAEQHEDAGERGHHPEDHHPPPPGRPVLHAQRHGGLDDPRDQQPEPEEDRQHEDRGDREDEGDQADEDAEESRPRDPAPPLRHLRHADRGSHAPSGTPFSGCWPGRSDERWMQHRLGHGGGMTPGVRRPVAWLVVVLALVLTAGACATEPAPPRRRPTTSGSPPR